MTHPPQGTSSAPEPSSVQMHLVSGVWILLSTFLSQLVSALVQRLADALWATVSTSVSINNQEIAYDWVMGYLNDVLLCADSSKADFERSNIRVVNQVNRDSNASISATDDPHSLLQHELGDGSHWIKFLDRWIHVEVSSSDKLTTRGFDKEPFQLHSISMTIYGNQLNVFSSFFSNLFHPSDRKLSSSNKDILQKLIIEAKEYYTKHKFEKQESNRIYLVSKWGNWMRCQSNTPKRSMDSVVLDRNISQFLLDDARNFIYEREWYHSLGIPYRRGYLLHGPPGNGKSSTVIALASELSLGICVLTLSSSNLDDQSLNELLHSTPSKCVILLEDIDSIFVAREAGNAIQSNRVTFSGFLNALDGVAAQEDKLFFMTTNHIEKLDPALLRPGRCDVKIKFNNASRKQIRRLFLKFHPEAQEDQVSKLVNLIPNMSVSCSALQEHFLKYDDPELAVEHCTEILKNHKQQSYNFAELKDINNSTISVAEWLKRLGCSRYTKTLYKMGVFSVDDTEEFEPSDLYDYHENIPVGHVARISGMIDGEGHVKDNFQLAPYWRVLELFQSYFNENPPDSFVQRVAGKVSSFQLMELFEDAEDSSDAVDHTNSLLNPPQHWFLSEKEEESMYKCQSVEEFFSNFSFENREDIVKQLKDASIYTTDDLICMSESLKEFGVTRKGDLIDAEIEVEKIKEARKWLKKFQKDCQGLKDD